jgi:hypothetical protein
LRFQNVEVLVAFRNHTFENTHDVVLITAAMNTAQVTTAQVTTAQVTTAQVTTALAPVTFFGRCVTT